MTDAEMEEQVSRLLDTARRGWNDNGRWMMSYLVFTAREGAIFVVNANSSKYSFLQVVKEQCKQLGARGVMGVVKGWSSRMPLGTTVGVRDQPDVVEALLGLFEDRKLGHRLYTAKIAADGRAGEFERQDIAGAVGEFSQVLVDPSELN